MVKWKIIPCLPVIRTIRQRLRVPEVIALTAYDRLPTAAVTFSRRNIFKRDHIHVPVLRRPARPRGADHRPRAAAVAGRNVDLGELRVVVRGLQQKEGRPNAGEGGHAAAQAAGAAGLEAALRRSSRADRELVEVRQRGVLERRAGELAVGLIPGPSWGGLDRFTGSCSWESKRPPKPPHEVQILAVLPFADVAEQRGAGFVNRSMLVPSASRLGKTGSRRLW